MRTNLKPNNETKDTVHSPTVIADMFSKKVVNFATTVENPSTQDFREWSNNIENNEDNIFAFWSNMTDSSITVGNLKSNKAVGIDGVSVEVLKTSLPLNFSVLF